MDDSVIWFFIIVCSFLGWRDGGKVMRETREGIREPAQEIKSLDGFIFGEKDE